MALHRMVLLQVAAAGTRAPAADEVATRDEGSELGGGGPAGGLAEAAVGDERQPLSGNAGREDRVDPLGDLRGGLDVIVLDVDHARGDVPPGRR